MTPPRRPSSGRAKQGGQGARVKGAAPPKAPEVIPLTGANASVDALASVVNETAAPFMKAPPPHQGAVGVASQALSGALGVINAPATLLDTGFAMATAGVASAFPALPAATLTAPHVGPPHPHSHPPSLVPPAPPVPLPSLGVIMGAGAISVQINGMPAARAGDVGIGLTCGSLAPPIEIILGSSSVFIGGARAARMTDVTRHCNPIGGGMNAFGKVMAAAGLAAGVLGAGASALDSMHESANAAKADAAGEAEAAAAAASGHALAAQMSAAQAAADAAALAMSLLVGKDPAIPPVLGLGVIMRGSPNVHIGGFPCPNLMECLKGLMKAAKGLRRGAKRKDDGDSGQDGNCPSCR